ncbi:SUMF1/EgtB/PvdO family nonheme iron enzyme [Tautonia rosea]|uniref:SUMF1/EgtB/PvdO family nonheme iron enzyme n=1 Tax=Tautonia rosea TaxID=2728037 RepID=UPI001C726720|nr:SUMF1/EgtB/PvdO family nonheme iron enzyme [Tautonia rosea]
MQPLRKTVPALLAKLALFVPVASGASQLDSQEVASLSRWLGPASLVSNPGPGETLYLLRASVKWSDLAPRQRARYAVQVRLPDGQVERRPMRPSEGPGMSVITVQIPAQAVRNRLPKQVRIEARLVDAASGTPFGESLSGTIDQFPTTTASSSRRPVGPFSRGRALDPTEQGAQLLPKPGPDGWRFARIVSSPEAPGLFLASTEATNLQVAARLPDHDPNAGRSDEFLLDAPDQPAVNLTPRRAEAYLEALSDADSSGLSYRFPSIDEWQRAARAGRSTGFWWGDRPEFPQGANFFGPEPGEASDTTVPASTPGYEANPWGLSHTFGNVEEWVRSPASGSVFARVGGHFRSDPDEALAPTMIDDPEDLGPDPYVGLRPAFDLDAEAGADLIRRVLADDPNLADVVVSFDPDRAQATLSGLVPEPSDRRRAVEHLDRFWWLAAVEDAMVTPTIPEGQLARIGVPSGPPRITSVLGRRFVEIPVAVRWDGPQPVVGSDWWVNVFGPRGEHFSHQLDRNAAGRSPLRISIPESLLDANRSARIALSLGRPESSPEGKGIVSDLATVTIRP